MAFGVNLPWQLLAVTLIGIWLMFTRLLFAAKMQWQIRITSSVR